MLMTSEIESAFILHLRCPNCRKDARQVLPFVDEDDAPTTVEDLLESEYLHRQRFVCATCDSEIGQVVSVKVREARRSGSR